MGCNWSDTSGTHTPLNFFSQNASALFSALHTLDKHAICYNVEFDEKVAILYSWRRHAARNLVFLYSGVPNCFCCNYGSLCCIWGLRIYLKSLALEYQLQNEPINKNVGCFLGHPVNAYCLANNILSFSP